MAGRWTGFMKALLQRVARGGVTVGEEVAGSIGKGLVVLVGAAQGDTAEDAAYLADRVINLRIFDDEQGKFNYSVADVQGELLVVSQFTLLAGTRKGRRPSFVEAAPPEQAEPLIESFVQHCRSCGVKVETGRFRAHMLVEIHNDGPVTIMLDSRDRFTPRQG